MGRAPCCDRTVVKRGPWSPEEDQLLTDYIQHHGIGGNWITLPQKAGLNRCGKSCRLRWLNYLRPDIKHGSFSPEEDHIICSLYHKLGSRWSIIASHLKGRTDNEVKNHWNTKLKKRHAAPPCTGADTAVSTQLAASEGSAPDDDDTMAVRSNTNCCQRSRPLLLQAVPNYITAAPLPNFNTSGILRSCIKTEQQLYASSDHDLMMQAHGQYHGGGGDLQWHQQYMEAAAAGGPTDDVGSTMSSSSSAASGGNPYTNMSCSSWRTVGGGGVGGTCISSSSCIMAERDQLITTKVDQEESLLPDFGLETSAEFLSAYYASLDQITNNLWAATSADQ